MLAVRASGGRVELAQVDEPRGRGVRVHVRAAGICGSDLHLVTGQLTQPDMILGHEIAGVTDDGTPVAVEPLVSCGACGHCIAGHNGRCDDALAKTMGVGIDGGMAEQMLVPEHLLVPLPTGLAVPDASLVEPVAVVVRALARAGVTDQLSVAVVGGGSIGLCAVAVARWFGATVELVARHDHQLEAGLRLGAVPATEAPADVVVEAAGTASALATAVEKCVVGGTVAIPASYWDPVEMPGMLMGVKEVTLMPSMLYGRTSGLRDVEVAADIVARTPELARALITHRFPLDGAPEAFAVAADRSAGAIKVVLEPGE